MISHLHVENFKCLRDVDVDLGPFTVLIGANDSGKSSVLDAIRLLGRTTTQPLPAYLREEGQNGTDPFQELVWRAEINRKIALAVTGVAEGKTYGYRLMLRAGPAIENEILSVDGQTPEGLPSYTDAFTTNVCLGLQGSSSALPLLKKVVPAFASSTKYRLDPRALRRTLPFSATPALDSIGENLPEALDALITGPERSAILRLEEALHAAVPTLSGVVLRTVQLAGKLGKAISFTLAGPSPAVTIPATGASEGALLLTAFLVIAYGESPDILLIEEPENGLHPTRLEMVISLLRKISTGEIGNRPRQVVMTTHSPLLLNYVKPEEVRIVRRDPELGTSITPMTAVPNLDNLLKEFAIGELWYLLTEEGLLKGEQP